MSFHQPIYDKSLVNYDIRGARSGYIEKEIKALQRENINPPIPSKQPSDYVVATRFGLNPDHQRSFQDVHIPQGDDYFFRGSKRHYERKAGEIEQSKALQNRFDLPASYEFSQPYYPRSLNVKDIEGAMPGSLQSKVVKNKEQAQKILENEKQQKGSELKDAYQQYQDALDQFHSEQLAKSQESKQANEVYRRNPSASFHRPPFDDRSSSSNNNNNNYVPAALSKSSVKFENHNNSAPPRREETQPNNPSFCKFRFMCICSYHVFLPITKESFQPSNYHQEHQQQQQQQQEPQRNSYPAHYPNNNYHEESSSPYKNHNDAYPNTGDPSRNQSQVNGNSNQKNEYYNNAASNAYASKLNTSPGYQREQGSQNNYRQEQYEDQYAAQARNQPRQLTPRDHPQQQQREQQQQQQSSSYHQQQQQQYPQLGSNLNLEGYVNQNIGGRVNPTNLSYVGPDIRGYPISSHGQQQQQQQQMNTQDYPVLRPAGVVGGGYFANPNGSAAARRSLVGILSDPQPETSRLTQQETNLLNRYQQQEKVIPIERSQYSRSYGGRTDLNPSGYVPEALRKRYAELQSQLLGDASHQKQYNPQQRVQAALAAEQNNQIQSVDSRSYANPSYTATNMNYMNSQPRGNALKNMSDIRLR